MPANDQFFCGFQPGCSSLYSLQLDAVKSTAVSQTIIFLHFASFYDHKYTVEIFFSLLTPKTVKKGILL